MVLLLVVVLRFIQLSNILEFIGAYAFNECHEIEVLFLLNTIKVIQKLAFQDCRTMRLLQLPHDIDLRDVVDGIICTTELYEIAQTQQVQYGDTPWEDTSEDT